AGNLKTFVVTNPAADVHPLLNGDQVSICRTSPNQSQCMFGTVGNVSALNPDYVITSGDNFGTGVSITVTITGTTGHTGTFNNWTITNHSSPGITICNATQATTSDSQSSTAAPLMRVSAGDYGLWGVGNGTACRWSDESGSPSGNIRSVSELNASSLVARRNTAATPSTHLNNGGVTNGDYIVRVLACDSAFIGFERCTQYPNGNFKPTGLLQDYAAGQQKKIKFGLMSGSYAKNKSGGVLRKNIDFLDSSTSAAPSSFNSALDEIDAGSGIFNSTVTGIIGTFNKIKLFGYTFPAAGSAGSYGAGGDNCTDPSVPNHTDNNCTSWGNPISEIYAEALRYFAG